ncbi:hypothetical protein NPIL_255261 [Nephila pilipes]|uniref:Uncharacterized protein n=1 Tax=Nephila pilipes TaxID=299642 RepID=A0A8X6P4G5_NEPPI|nr:hypothetical protein NPIL_255261 [Nephila pilipes]
MSLHDDRMDVSNISLGSSVRQFGTRCYKFSFTAERIPRRTIGNMSSSENSYVSWWKILNGDGISQQSHLRLEEMLLYAFGLYPIILKTHDTEKISSANLSLL